METNTPAPGVCHKCDSRKRLVFFLTVNLTSKNCQNKKDSSCVTQLIGARLGPSYHGVRYAICRDDPEKMAATLKVHK